jgi:homopolymeric O-antigen transport system ATP-binding protein
VTTDLAITAEGLGKRYRLGEDTSQRRLLEGLLPWRTRRAEDEFWALRGVSFTVKQGEAIGIIGRNGAGKSTLLKLLSRVSAPSEGQATVQGRVGTMLEVGTGFHPELTGRENIFLSGSILGMSYPEVKSKFDEIVAFAEVEQFIDTPVKRYSSGMYVRLAFAVAAFLEPEILIIDEVLAVGDAAFQRKSLGRLNEVSARDGRTVLFVSHSLQVIRSFCTRVLVLDRGRVIFDGPTEDGIARYLRSIPTRADLRGIASKDRLQRTTGDVRFTEVTCNTAAGENAWRFCVGDTVGLKFHYEVEQTVRDLVFHFRLRSAMDDRVITVIREVISDSPVARGRSGIIELELPNLRLMPGEISLYAVLMSVDDRFPYDVVDTNVDLPLLVIASDGVDKYSSAGLIAVDYKLRSHVIEPTAELR